jgi:hypothetical protein
MRVIRGMLTVTGLAGAAATAGWFALARAQGDSEVGYGPSTVLGTDEHSVHAEVELVNRGREAGVIRKVEATLVEGPPGRVLVTRKDSQPPQRGWWVSNILKPGETCVAEIDVELVGPGPGPVIVALDAHEIGRRLLVHRRARFTLPIGVPSPSS